MLQQSATIPESSPNFSLFTVSKLLDFVIKALIEVSQKFYYFYYKVSPILLFRSLTFAMLF